MEAFEARCKYRRGDTIKLEADRSVSCPPDLLLEMETESAPNMSVYLRYEEALRLFSWLGAFIHTQGSK